MDGVSGINAFTAGDHQSIVPATSAATAQGGMPPRPRQPKPPPSVAGMGIALQSGHQPIFRVSAGRRQRILGSR